MCEGEEVEWTQWNVTKKMYRKKLTADEDVVENPTTTTDESEIVKRINFRYRLNYIRYVVMNLDTKKLEKIELPNTPDVLVSPLYEYDYDVKRKELIHVRATEWTRELSVQFFPNKKPCGKFDVVHYGPKLPAEIQSWMNFDYYNWIKKLCPYAKSPDKVIEFIQKRDFRGLLRDIGNVDPVVLEDFLYEGNVPLLPQDQPEGEEEEEEEKPKAKKQKKKKKKDDDDDDDVEEEEEDENTQILREAALLFRIRELMKEHRKVWLPSTVTQAFMEDILQPAFNRLRDSGLIVYRDHCTTLAWAAKQYDEFMKTHTKIRRYVHDSMFLPVRLHEIPNNVQELPFDTTVAVDFFIDRQMVVVTMLNGPWEDEPDAIFSLSRGLTVSYLQQQQQQHLKVVHANDLKSGLLALKETNIPFRSLTISASGNIHLDQPFTYTVQVCAKDVEKKFPKVFKLDEILTACYYPQDPSKMQLWSTKHDERILVDEYLVNALTKRASACTFDESMKIRGKYNAVFCIGGRNTHIRRLRQAMLIAEGAPCTFLMLGQTYAED